MNKIFAIILLVTFSNHLFAKDKEIILTNIQVGNYFDMYSISEEQASELPAWTPSDGKEPIGIFEALEKVREKHPVLKLNLLTTRVGSIKHKSTEIWFYTIDYGYPNIEVVLMNGAMVKPKRVSREEYFKHAF